MNKLHIPSSLIKRSAMTRRQRLLLGAMISFGVILTAVFGAWWFEPSHIPANYHGWRHVLDFLLFGVLSYIIWHQIVGELFTWGVAKDMKHPHYMRPAAGQRVAFLTAFVPGKEPYDILENSLRHMVAVDYPHDTWLLDEGDDERAKEICERLGVRHYTRRGIPHYNTEHGPFRTKTKGGNHNSWHHQNGQKYDFVAQIDVDFVPRKDFLTMTLGYFRDPKVAFVGTPQIYGNLDEPWIVQGAAEQAYGFYGVTQKGFFGKDMQLFIGANHVVRVAALNDIGGYSGHIVEDHLTGMKMYTRRWKSVYVPEKLAIGEGPATWDAYFSQQMRWAYGLIDILLHHSPKLLPKMKRQHAINYYFLAFVGVITGKRLTYAVTPKGAQQESHVPLTLFMPHFVLGTITAIDIILSFTTGHRAPLLLFWAVVNTVTMYGFILHVTVQRLAKNLSRRVFART